MMSDTQPSAFLGRGWSISSLFLLFGAFVWFVTLAAAMIPFIFMLSEAKDISERLVEVAQLSRQNRQIICREYDQFRSSTGKSIPSVESLCAH